MRVLLITPPMTQLNAPYAATPCLAGFLEGRGVSVAQADASLELARRLFSRKGIEAIARSVRGIRGVPPSVLFFRNHARRYAATVDAAVRFLCAPDPIAARRIAGRRFLPEGPRFEAVDTLAACVAPADPLDWAFDGLGIEDRARYLASLYLDDLADVIRDGVDDRFGLSRYGEKLAVSAPSFDPIRHDLETRSTLVDRHIEAIASELVKRCRPGLVGFTIPFPGCLYGALRMARRIRQIRPSCRVAIGGGYVSTELRALSEPGLFDYVDYVLLDDGELPLLCLVEHLEGRRPRNRLCRTFVRERGRVLWLDACGRTDFREREKPAPSFAGLDFNRYLSLCELPNPAYALWSAGRWNKMRLAHGCYWGRCRFCDTSLDYIRRYDAPPAAVLVDRMEAVMRRTGESGFHFVDEAAPPGLLRALSGEILRRGLAVTWWTNIRFERAFTPGLIRQLARAGCIAVCGGLETASDRLLGVMQKGITLRDGARISGGFSKAGILVHAYLMYGFPTQTVQETVDALERVRQLFRTGCIRSAYWHRFALTVHSRMIQAPALYGMKIADRLPAAFARNEVAFEEAGGADHNRLGAGLRKALYNYLHGVGLEEDVRTWFDLPVPKPSIPKNPIARSHLETG